VPGGVSDKVRHILRFGKIYQTWQLDCEMKNVAVSILIAAAVALGGCGEADDSASGEAMVPSTEISAERGKTVFLRCQACHALEKGKTNAAGPTLHGIFGMKAGSRPGFSYSPALMDSGLVWNDQTLDTYLEKPQQAVPGTRMAFAGLRNDAERASLIAYLKEATQ